MKDKYENLVEEATASKFNISRFLSEFLQVDGRHFTIQGFEKGDIVCLLSFRNKKNQLDWIIEKGNTLDSTVRKAKENFENS